MRRVGVLMALSGADPESSRRLTALRQACRPGLDRGWQPADRRAAYSRKSRALAPLRANLVEFEPNVILAIGSTTLAPLEQATRTVPIVLTLTADPLGGGFVENLARSGGNAIAEDADV
jgi:putative ABC transport system substrate-binding protein